MSHLFFHRKKTRGKYYHPVFIIFTYLLQGLPTPFQKSINCSKWCCNGSSLSTIYQQNAATNLQGSVGGTRLDILTLSSCSNLMISKSQAWYHFTFHINVLPQSCITQSIGSTVRPNSVIEYSTLGGTSAYTFR